MVAVAFAVVASLLWIELPVDALTTTVGATDRTAAQPGLPWLSVADRHIVDDAGRVVMLHGFNTSTLLEATVLRSPLDDGDAATMESEGFDVVRLAVSWGRLEPRRGSWDQAYLQSIADTVSMLTSHRLYVVLDMHFLDWSSALGGSGAPDWATVPLAPDLHISALGDWQRHLSPAVNAATTYFWLSPDWQTDFMEAWQTLAARFRGDSGVAGYDLYNEPHAIPIPPVRFEKDVMWPLYAHTVDAIGAVDPNHLFIVEGQLLADFGTTVVPLRAPNLVYSSHEYTGSLVPPMFDGNSQALDDHVRQGAGEAAAVPAALWVGEWGMAATQPQAGSWVDAALSAFASAGTGWAWWQWREDSSWGIRDTAGHTDTALLSELARPYVMAAPPGVSVAPAREASDTVALTTSASYRGDALVIGWPALAHPPQVTSTCGTVASTYDPTAGRLTVTSTAATACAITVT